MIARGNTLQHTRKPCLDTHDTGHRDWAAVHGLRVKTPLHDHLTGGHLHRQPQRRRTAHVWASYLRFRVADFRLTTDRSYHRLARALLRRPREGALGQDAQRTAVSDEEKLDEVVIVLLPLCHSCVMRAEHEGAYDSTPGRCRRCSVQRALPQLPPGGTPPFPRPEELPATRPGEAGECREGLSDLLRPHWSHDAMASARGGRGAGRGG
mmetsp:Transcript_415/g.1134  ORF Transcript_415/g.1134 Transcript_415/m.1134 type:complete len:209 (-) Transcript_415:74-700(-)